MELNQSTLRGILAAILSVDQKYVVPKQGNWWNPQEQGAAPATWCAYLIRSNKPRTAPQYHEEGGVNYASTEKIARIELQFVGKDAEALAQSVSLWHLRGDVQEQFRAVQGAVMYCDGDAIPSNFAQDGTNTVLAWNVTISVLWWSLIETTQGSMPMIALQAQ
jgi:hypothetical protein